MNKLNKLMLALAVGAAALAVGVVLGGAAEADEDRFRFADCSVEFILQDGRFVAVDGRSWAEVDPGGECHDTAEDDEGAEGEGDDPPADDGGTGGDGSRSAPAGSAAAEANQQDDSEDGAGSADGSFEPSLSAGVLEELARWAQENPPDAPPPCTDAVKPETGPTSISFQDNDHCVIVRDGGAVQVSRGGDALNVTLPAGRDWRVSSFVHPLVRDMFMFSEITTPYIFATVNLNAADGVVLRRRAGDCEYEYFYEGEQVFIASSSVSYDADGTVVAASWTTRDGTVHQGFPPDGVLVCPSTLLDALVASVTVPAAAAEE